MIHRVELSKPSSVSSVLPAPGLDVGWPLSSHCSIVQNILILAIVQRKSENDVLVLYLEKLYRTSQFKKRNVFESEIKL